MTDRDLTKDELEILRKVRALHDKDEQSLAQEIGLFIMRFAKLETVINLAIGRLFDLRNISMAILLGAAIRDTNARIHLLSSLVGASRMEPGLRRKLERCITRIRNLNTYRNNLIHDEFSGPTYEISEKKVGGGKQWPKHTAKVQNKFTLETKEFSIPEIRDRRKQCEQIGPKLFTLVIEYASYREKRRSSQK